MLIGGAIQPQSYKLHLPYKPKTFDRADCGVMYTNQAQGDARTTAECQYLSEAGLCLLLMEKEK